MNRISAKSIGLIGTAVSLLGIGTASIIKQEIESDLDGLYVAHSEAWHECVKFVNEYCKENGIDVPSTIPKYAQYIRHCYSVDNSRVRLEEEKVETNLPPYSHDGMFGPRRVLLLTSHTKLMHASCEMRRLGDAYISRLPRDWFRRWLIEERYCTSYVARMVLSIAPMHVYAFIDQFDSFGDPSKSENVEEYMRNAWYITLIEIARRAYKDDHFDDFLKLFGDFVDAPERFVPYENDLDSVIRSCQSSDKDENNVPYVSGIPKKHVFGLFDKN